MAWLTRDRFPAMKFWGQSITCLKLTSDGENVYLGVFFNKNIEFIIFQKQHKLKIGCSLGKRPTVITPWHFALFHIMKDFVWLRYFALEVPISSDLSNIRSYLQILIAYVLSFQKIVRWWYQNTISIGGAYLYSFSCHFHTVLGILHSQ